jgi:solute carrier family 25 phosphate transporter 23/24/25/41
MYSKADLTIWGMTRKIMREEGGVRGLYRGLVTTAVGVAPYVGINFAAYELLRDIITPPGKNNVVRKLSCGALAGEYFSFLTRWSVVIFIILPNFRNNFANRDIPL